MAEEALTVEISEGEHGLRLGVPEEVAARYHLVPGVRVEVVQTEDGILLVPLDVEPWFSPEWEEAMDFVLSRYGEALEELGG